MFELTASVAGWACGLLFVAALLLLGYSLWSLVTSDLVTSDRENPPHEPGQLALQPAPPTQTRLP